MDNKKSIFLYRERAYQYLVETHKEYGHFPIFEDYPFFDLKKDKGWHYTFRSPFLHANVMYSLINSNIDKSEVLLNKAALFLYNTKEKGDLWRFWFNGEAEYPVAIGTEDTAISSIVLRKLNFKLKNRSILLSRINKNGSILTWVNPDIKLFFININSFFSLLKHRKNERITIEADMFNYFDAEPTISATVLAYLGENKKTKKVVDYLIYSWTNEIEDKYQFYEKNITLAFHLARAYNEGIISLHIIKDSVFDYIMKHHSSFSFPEDLIAYLTLKYFKFEHELLLILKKRILEKVKNRDAFTDFYPYITSKDRVYFGGGGTLTAAWFLEASKDWE